MKRLLTAFFFLICIISGVSANAQTANYDATTRYLSIPSIRVGDTVYSDLVIRLDGMTLISVGAAVAAGPTVAERCGASNFTTAKFNAITVNMTVDQVNQVMGCKYNSTLTQRNTSYLVYVWDYGQSMVAVYFDPDGTRATFYAGIIFKMATGF